MITFIAHNAIGRAFARLPLGKDPSMFRGLTTVSFYADDHAAAKDWYSRLFKTEPYFDVPGYFEFRLGDHQHEFGVIDAAYAPPGATDGPAGSIAYWHVDDLEATMADLTSLGAVEYQPINERGDGFVTASVVDPFGNIFGVMRNQHFLDMLNTE